jgi:hypothetical protein
MTQCSFDKNPAVLKPDAAVWRRVSAARSLRLPGMLCSGNRRSVNPHSPCRADSVPILPDAVGDS